MKLRIRGNSVRLRLTQSEVVRLARTGLVEETVDFGSPAGGRFAYALAVGGERTSAVFENNRLTVFVPEAGARRWAQSEQIGIRAEQTLGGEKTLRILVEKDFACLEYRPGEDESDAFANPAGRAC